MSKRARILVATSLEQGDTGLEIDSSHAEPHRQSDMQLESPVPTLSSPIPLWWNEMVAAINTTVKRRLFLPESEQKSENFLSLVPLEQNFEDFETLAPVGQNSEDFMTLAPLHPAAVNITNTAVPVPANDLSDQLPSETEVINIMQVDSDISLPTTEAEETNLCSTVDPVPITVNTKKAKKFYPSQVKVDEAKIALNSGLEHTAISGKIRPARSLKPTCKTTCKRCKPRLSDDIRLDLLQAFWALGNHESQWKYLLACVKCSVPKKKCTASGSKGEKHFTREYCFEVNGCSIRVCKTMFKSTLAICDSWINSALSHSSSSAFLQDQRGKCKEKLKAAHSQQEQS